MPSRRQGRSAAPPDRRGPLAALRGGPSGCDEPRQRAGDMDAAARGAGRARLRARAEAVSRPSRTVVGKIGFCSAVESGRRLWSWNTKPMWRLRTSVRARSWAVPRSCPSIERRPEVGCIRVPRMVGSVLSPDPEGPISAASSPAPRLRPRPLSACVGKAVGALGHVDGHPVGVACVARREGHRRHVAQAGADQTAHQRALRHERHRHEPAARAHRPHDADLGPPAGGREQQRRGHADDDGDHREGLEQVPGLRLGGEHAHQLRRLVRPGPRVEPGDGPDARGDGLGGVDVVELDLDPRQALRNPEQGPRGALDQIAVEVDDRGLEAGRDAVDGDLGSPARPG